MRVAITGGTGFVGRHLARESVARGHQAVLVARGRDVRDECICKESKTSFFKSDLSDPQELRGVFLGCDAVAHCAGINREIGAQTYLRVHVEGTKHVVEAARLARVRKIVLLSFLRARPNCGSAYHATRPRPCAERPCDHPCFDLYPEQTGHDSGFITMKKEMSNP